jgi:uncharacterized protein DUF4232
VRRTLLGALALTLLAGCGVQAQPRRPPTPATTSTSVPAAVECTSDGVAFSFGGADAAMGVRVQNIEIVNCGGEPVTVDGYPGLRLYDEERNQLDVVVAHGSRAVATVPALDVPPSPVVLAPGESAWAGMVWRNLVTDSTVQATTAVAADVTLGQDTAWQHLPETTIDLGNTTTIGVGPWQRRHQEPATAPPATDDDSRT